MRLVPAAAVAALLVTGGSVAGCTSSKPSPQVTVTAGNSAGSGGAVSSTRASASGSGPGSGSASATPKPTSTTTLRGTCESILPLSTVETAVGTTVAGRTAFVVNQPDYSLGQVERVNCRYGVEAAAAGSTQDQVKVEVSISLYAADKQASERVAATSNEWRGQGAAPHTVQVSGHSATVLVGYGQPLLVLAVGPRTVAVTIVATLVPAATLDTALTAVAAQALSGAGG